MADIAAANVGTFDFVSLGNKRMVSSKVKGDGTGVTVNVPLARIDYAWVQAIDDVDGSTHLPLVPGISWSGAIITYVSAPTINKYHQLFCVGF